MKPLTPLEAVPITHGVVMVKVDLAAKYIVFINGNEFGSQDDIDRFITDEANPIPAGSPVYVIYGPIDNAIRIYELFDTKLVTKAADNGR